MLHQVLYRTIFEYTLHWGHGNTGATPAWTDQFVDLVDSIPCSQCIDPDPVDWDRSGPERSGRKPRGVDPMIEFPPEFYGLVEALWSTYQPAIWVWLALMFIESLVGWIR
jgi:hypothetical protein